MTGTARRRRVLLSFVSVACAAIGMLVVPAVSVAATTPAANATRGTATHSPTPRETPAKVAQQTAPRPLVSDCDGAVAFASTTQCDFGDSGTAAYTVTTTGPDRLRVRAAEPTASAQPTVTVRNASNSPICVHAGSDQFDCPTSGSGLFTVQVAVAAATTVYTTVDSVRTPGNCAASADLGVNAPGIDVPVVDPGASYCTYLPDAALGDVLRFVFHSTADDPLHITIYSSARAVECAVAPLFTASECKLGGGSGFRMFVNWEGDFPRSTVLYATRLSHPSDCPTGAPDDLGSPPTRTGVVYPFRVRCFAAPTDTGHPLAVRVVSTVPTRVLTWSLRAPNGLEVCAGDTLSGATLCSAPEDGRYALFVAGQTGSNGGPRTRVLAFLASALDSAGCVPLPSTAFGADAVVGTLAEGQVDCRTFDGANGHQVQITDWDLLHFSGVALVGPSGTIVCRSQHRLTCVLPVDGTYRILVWADRTTDPVDYSLWATDLDDPAGCSTIAADAFGVAPSSTGAVDHTTANQCWTLSADKGQAFLLGLGTASGALFARATMRELNGNTVCTVVTNSRTGCRIPHTGTYEIMVAQYLDAFDPTQGGVVRLGLWRLDQPTGCTATSTSFAAPALDASLTGVDEVDCATVTTLGPEVLFVSSGNGDPELSLQHQVYNAAGRRLCLLYPGGECRVHEAGTYYVLTYALRQDIAPYTMSVRSVTRHRGCQRTVLRDFGTAPVSQFEAGPGVPACLAFVRAASTGRVLLRVHADTGPAPRYTLHNMNGRPTCAGTLGARVCNARGTGPFVLVLSSGAPSSGVVGFYSTADSGGCTTAPSLGFDARPLQGSIHAGGEVDCVDLGASSQKRILHLAAAKVPAGSVLHFGLFDSSGGSRCEVRSTDYFRYKSCAIRAGLPLRLLIWLDEGEGPSTGRYGIHVWDVHQPTGCGSLGGAGGGLGPVLGQLADPNDQDCYQFSATASTVLHFTVTNDGTSDEVPVVDVLYDNGQRHCQIFGGTGTCTISISGHYSLIVFGASGVPAAVRYRIEATTD
jgi:hypothetical protein